MKPTKLLSSLLVSATVGWLPAHAVSISLIPSSPSISLGSNVDMDVVISGLNPSGGLALGAWAGTIQFDPSILSISAAQVAFGVNLDLGINGSDKTTDDSSAASGSLSLSEISFETIPDLESFQSASFVLATLTFNSLSAGSSSVSFSNGDFSDADGNSISGVDASPTSVEVRSGTPSVPDHLPALAMWATLALLLRQPRAHRQSP